MTKVNACIEAGYMFLLITPAMLVPTDRKSTRLNSSHGYLSYAGFCLQKKQKAPRLPGWSMFAFSERAQTHRDGGTGRRCAVEPRSAISYHDGSSSDR